MTTEKNLRGLLGPKGKGNPSGEGEDTKVSTDEELNKALKTITKASAIKILSTPEPLPPPPPPPDPTAMAKLTIETARAMSSEEREDRHKVEKETKDAEEKQHIAEEKQHIAEGKTTEAIFERQKDFLGHQVGELVKAAEELKKTKEGGSPASVAQRTNELADAIESVKKLVQVMAPQVPGTTQSVIQHFVTDLKAIEEARELLGGRKQESPMVNMSNLSQMPAQYAIELRKIELEDARIREIRKEELKIESQKKEAQEGLIGMIMGICGSFLNSVGGVAAPVSQNAANQPAQPPPQPQSEPEMVRFDCRDCGQTMMIPKAQAAKVQICPFCGPKVVEREVVREVPQRAERHEIVEREGTGDDGSPQADVQPA